ncbi:MAG: hypothetical protein ACRDK9_11590 [Solirubrobacterales bacterium]
MIITLLAAACAAVGVSTLASGAMQSVKLEPRVCETTGGGRFVDIPGFPGERIDRRLLTDIRWLRKRYSIYVTDGHSLDDVHASNGEHPVGLALDIVPDKAAGGRWSDIGRLARWAEPRQGHPRFPFRWVGYNGDANHGKRHHLHLSWSHSPARYNRPARTVYTVRCPKPGAGATAPPPQPLPPPEAEPTAPPPPPPSGGSLARPHPESGGVSSP